VCVPQACASGTVFLAGASYLGDCGACAPGSISAANAKLSMQQEADYLTSCASCVSTWNAWSPKDKRCYFMGPESSAHGKMLPNAKMWLDMSRKDPTVLVRDRSQCPAKKGRGEL
jgi:hypothetical protein